MNLGRNIKYLRQTKGVTQEALASCLGVSYQAVSKWETESNTPDISLLPKIAAFFQTSIDMLFCEDISQCAVDYDLIRDDDVIRVIQMRGKEMIRVDSRVSPNGPPIEIAFPRNCNGDTQYFKVEIHGHVVADSSINGDVLCHQTIHCADINGSVKCDGDIHAANINSFGKITCKQILECYHLQCNRLECESATSANLTATTIVKRE